MKTILLILLMLFTAGCSQTQTSAQKIEWKDVSALVDESHAVLVDVRTPEEYAAGHVPGAINIPNETITETILEDLPDQDQQILVYCRSGARSSQAAAKLKVAGYEDVTNLGGIGGWTGSLQTGSQP